MMIFKTILRLAVFILYLVLFVPLSAYIAVEKLGFSHTVGLGIGILFSYVLFRFRPTFLGGSGRCSICSKSVNKGVTWEEDLNTEERLRLESYIDLKKTYSCRKCGRLYCDRCAMETRFHCRSCDSWGFRSGYSSNPS